MGGGQSKEKTSEYEEETKDTLSQPKELPTEPSYTTVGTDFKIEVSAELPQSQMGSKSVDDMAFMISCTNWY